ncbi:MAG: tetraacyldisaccharide 4'-kinase [Prevotella sp.]|nr:tetraacyldisaccharide 4'-kinase [Prevotella sp.]
MRLEGDFIKINTWLLPFSWFYGLGVKLRNTLFDIGVLKSRSFKVPVISVGNITVGGTGKTPHVEYLANLLKDHFHVAVLSRGYKRKSKGFLTATPETPMPDIGDEPYQMKQKFPSVTVAVDKNRCHGINLLTENDKLLDVVLLDDAFQHRYVKPGINILLVDYHRLIIYDKLLPAGRLREPLSGKDRADIVIVTKCPPGLKPMEYRVITRAMDLYPYQQLYFTTLEYDKPRPVLKDSTRSIELDTLNDTHVLLLTGIASPKQLEHDLSPLTSHLTPLNFSDHHQFRKKDIQLINDTFSALPSPKAIITTEKDATRLEHADGLSDEVKANIYVLPVRISFMQGQEENFNNQITGYVRKNSRNSILAKDKDDNKPQDSHHPGNRTRTISFRNN